MLAGCGQAESETAVSHENETHNDNILSLPELTEADLNGRSLIGH